MGRGGEVFAHRASQRSGPHAVNYVQSFVSVSQTLVESGCEFVDGLVYATSAQVAFANPAGDVLVFGTRFGAFELNLGGNARRLRFRLLL